MAKLVINRGTVAGDGTGEILYDAFGKVNSNFTELYDLNTITGNTGTGDVTTLDGMECQADVTGTPKHIMQWLPAVQGQAPLCLSTFYTGFTSTQLDPITGDLDGTTNVITNVSSVGRIVEGMSISGTGIPASTTVTGVDSDSQISLSNATTQSGNGVTLTVNAVSPLTVYDPVINFGYNMGAAGNPVVAGKGICGFQIEGHYDRGGPNDDVWMEAFVTMRGPGAAGPNRPIFMAYDKELNKVVQVSMAASAGYETTVQGHRFAENELRIVKSGTTTNVFTQLRVESHSTKGADFIMTKNGEDPNVTPSFRARCTYKSTTTQWALKMYDNAATPDQKTGECTFWASPSIESVRMSIGRAGTGGIDVGMINIFQENSGTGTVGLYIKSNVSQTASLLRLDGVNDSTGAVEVATWTVRPKGTVVVRESGNTATDRGPTATAPGGGTSKYFPVLDENGALYYVTGVPA